MSQLNKDIANRWIDEVWNQGNLDAIDDLINADYVHHEPGSPDLVGREAMKHYVSTAQSAFPDMFWVIDDMVSEEDKVVIRFTGNGTHQGSFGEIAPTGNQVKIEGTATLHLKDGKLAEAWDHWDVLGTLRQLGMEVQPK